MARVLPDRPSIQYYRNEAKDLARAVRQGQPAASRRARRLGEASSSAFALSAAQRIIAQEHGFASWERFRRHVVSRAAIADPLTLDPRRYRLSPEARSPESAVARLRAHGFVVLEGILDPTSTAELRVTSGQVLDRRNKSVCWVPLELVRRPPFGHPRVVRNDALVPILARMLGPGFGDRERWIRSVRPGAGPKRVHRDRAPAGAALESLSVDFLLTPFTEANGATRIWPGSHLVPDRNLADVRETSHRAALRASTHLEGEPGAVVIRDPRVWHCAAGNATAERRIMLSLVYRRIDP